MHPDYAGEICHAFNTVFKNWLQAKEMSLQYLLDWEEFLCGMGKVPCISLQPSRRHQISSLPPHSGQRIDYYHVQVKKKGQDKEGSNEKKSFLSKGMRGKTFHTCSVFWKTLHPPVLPVELQLCDS